MGIFFLFLASMAAAQTQPIYKDTVLVLKVDSLKQEAKKKLAIITNTSDSLTRKGKNWTDSVRQITQKVSSFPQSLDTLKFLSRIDSLREKMESLATTDRLFLFDPQLRKIDSLKVAMQNQANAATTRIDKTTDQIQNSIDSIRRQYTEKAELILQKWGINNPGMEKYQTEIFEKMDWNAPSVSTKFPEFTNDFNFKHAWPDLKMGDFKLDDLQKMNFDGPSINLPGMPSQSLESLKKLKESFGKARGIGQELKGYQAELDSLRSGGLANSEKLKSLAEQQLMQRQEIQTIKEHEQEIEKLKQLQAEYKAKAEEYRDPEKLKSEALQKAGEVATDQLLAQQDKLTQAQSKLDKAKRKYGDVQSINDLPKRPPNPMKGVPFRERFFPGVTFQYAKKDQYSTLYLSPQIYYRINGRWDLGGGGIVNLNFDNNPHWVEGHDLWGYKALVNFRFFKSFYFRLEGERVNQELPMASSDKTYKRWTNVILGGIGKEFSISKRFKGQTILLYNYKEMEFNPYSSRIVLRVGIDLSLKKDQRKQFIRSLRPDLKSN